MIAEFGLAALWLAAALAALQLLAGPADVALVFTDLVMPDMSGQELAATVRARYQSVKVLLTSGYSEEFANSEDLSGQRLRLLRKPYRMAELADAVRAALTETSF